MIQGEQLATQAFDFEQQEKGPNNSATGAINSELNQIVSHEEQLQERLTNLIDDFVYEKRWKQYQPHEWEPFFKKL